MKRLSLSIATALLLAGCGSQPVKQNNSNIAAQILNQQALPIESITLPDGKVVTGKRIDLSNGKYYIGDLRDNKYIHGKGVIVGSDSYWLGTFSQDIKQGAISIGLHTHYNLLNNLKIYKLHDDKGNLIKQYTEFDEYLAQGDYEKVYELRGENNYMGLSFDIRNGATKVLEITPNSPASLADIRAGDILEEISGINVRNTDDTGLVIKAIMAEPFGQKKKFVIQRGNTILNKEFVAGVIPKNYKNVTPTSQLLWEHVSSKDSSNGYQRYLDNIVDTTYHPQAKSRLAELMKNEKAAYTASQSQGVEGAIDFCQKYPDSIYLSDLFKTTFNEIESSNHFATLYSKLSSECKQTTRYQPADYALLPLGPDDMTIVDTLSLKEKGIGESIIASKIKGAQKPYRDFSYDEIASLKRMGLTDIVISAMIDATFANKEQAEKAAYQQQLQTLQAENSQLKQKASVAQAQTQAKNDESNMPLECVKLVAAIKACDQAGGFLAMGCKAVARSNFDCPIPVDQLF